MAPTPDGDRVVCDAAKKQPTTMAELNPDFQQRYSTWILVCGASADVGEASRSAGGAAGLNVVLMARRKGVRREA